MTRIEFTCDRCGTRVLGNYTNQKTHGFYIVDTGEYEKYGLPGEHLIHDVCIHQNELFQAEHGQGVTINFHRPKRNRG